MPRRQWGEDEVDTGYGPWQRNSSQMPSNALLGTEGYGDKTPGPISGCSVPASQALRPLPRLPGGSVLPRGGEIKCVTLGKWYPP